MNSSHNITLLGSGLIGMFYTLTLHQFRSRDTVKTVFSRSEERVKKFAADWNIPKWTTNMEEAINDPDTDVVIGEWQDGRVGILRGTRFEKGAFGCVVHTDQGTQCGVAQSTPPYYYLMLQEVIRFFQTRVSPVDINETLGIVSFLEAADTSRAQGGKVIKF